MTEYCFLKNNVVQAIYVCDEQNAKETKECMGFDECIPRPNLFVGIGHTYRDGKFYTTIKDEAGTDVEMELC